MLANIIQGIHAGLKFRWNGGEVVIDGTERPIPPGSLDLEDGATSYIECRPDRALAANTAGWTAGYIPLFTVLTASGEITAVTAALAFSAVAPSGGLPGAFMSEPSRRMTLQMFVPTIADTTDVLFRCPVNARVVGGAVAIPTGFAADETDYWNFSILKDPNGTPVLYTVVATAQVNSTGTVGIGAYGAKLLTMEEEAVPQPVADEILVFNVSTGGDPDPLLAVSLSIDLEVLD